MCVYNYSSVAVSLCILEENESLFVAAVCHITYILLSKDWQLLSEFLGDKECVQDL